MAKNTLNDNLKLEAFPEEVTEEGIRVYSETSYENQLAVLSQYLHNKDGLTFERKAETISAIRNFLMHKQYKNNPKDEDLSDEEVLRVAEDACQYELFSDFYNVPFPAPEHPRFTFIDLFVGIGGFRMAS